MIFYLALSEGGIHILVEYPELYYHNIDPSVLRDITIDDINRENFTIYPITPYGSVMCSCLF